MTIKEGFAYRANVSWFLTSRETRDGLFQEAFPLFKTLNQVI